MKEHLSLLAQYNAHVNRELYEIVAKLTDADLKKGVGSFYTSIFGLLNHIYRSDCGWLLRIRDNLAQYPALDSELLKDPMPTGTGPMFEEFATLKDKRPVLDDLIRRFVTELPEEDLVKRFTVTLRSGDKKTLILWEALTHMFNHETHHRGAISQILDEMDVTNDYSNLMSIL